MSKAYQFPHDEPNPFAEPAESAPEAAASENPYLASSAANEPPGGPAQIYHQTLQPRVGLLSLVSVLALLTGLGALGLAFWYLPLGLITLPIAIAAFIMARHDAQAMKFGAMDAAQVGSVRLLLGLALVAGLISLVSLVVFVALLIRAFSQ